MFDLIINYLYKVTLRACNHQLTEDYTMNFDKEAIKDFIDFVKRAKKYEKGEGQTFLNKLWRVFGYKDVDDANGHFEDQIKIDKTTKFSDMLIEGKVLVEMKSGGENLENHWRQAKQYWDELYSKRPTYIMLSNFDEIWIYNWNIQKEALDKISIQELASDSQRWEAFNFLLKEEQKPKFRNDLEEVTREVADKLVFVYNSLVKRKKEIQLEKTQIQRFVLQCLVALFAEDVNLFPKSDFFKEIIEDCLSEKASSYDLFNELFQSMNNPQKRIGGRFKNIAYFNGGLFKEINPIELNREELQALKEASDKDWSKVQPYILGAIFEDSMEKGLRHAYGAHFTSEADIMKIVEPTILRPFREEVEKAKTQKDYENILKKLSNFKVLDPACGSGNFLYIAYRELKHLEIEVFQAILDKFSSQKLKKTFVSGINSKNFFGMDINEFAVEIAKVTMSIAKKYGADDFNEFLSRNDKSLTLAFDNPLPFDNMDNNIVCKDALFNDWEETDVIISNPPYITYNDMNKELGIDYTAQVRAAYPEIPGRADYCVWWFRKAQDTLKKGGRAGLVGTNTITQNYSRIGGLDYIVEHGGVIFDAISSQVWSGAAAVYVSIVNWQKEPEKPIKQTRLLIPNEEKKNATFTEYHPNCITSSLRPICDVSKAKDLMKTNDNPKTDCKTCFQGQTVDSGFLISKEDYIKLSISNSINSTVLKPFMVGEDLIGTKNSLYKRYAIDLNNKDIFEIQQYKELLKIVENTVLPIVKNLAEKQEQDIKEGKTKSRDRINHYKKWWTYWRDRKPLMDKLQNSSKYIVCSRVTKRPIFEFISSKIAPGDALNCFTFTDDYSFGILSSNCHYKWYNARCSTLKGDPRYTNTTTYNSFVWPQFGIPFAKNPEKYLEDNKKEITTLISNVAICAREFYLKRDEIRRICKMSLRDIYRTMEKHGDNPLRDLQDKLNDAVLECYKFGILKSLWSDDILEMLYKLNIKCAELEGKGVKLLSPGLPEFLKDKQEFYTDYCIKPD